MNINSDYQINEHVFQTISEILQDYDVVEVKRTSFESEKVFLTDYVPNKCRFCGKSFPEVSFQSEAHTIPEFLGNKKLFSKFECDNCNKDYFNKFETEMANFMLPSNTIIGAKGKKNKIPKYNLKGQPLINFEPDKIYVSGVSDSNLIHSGNSIEFPIKLPSFIPEYIFRCLIKIGLSILPENKLSNYKDTITWLMNIEAQSNVQPFMIFSIYPYNLQLKEFTCTIFERKEDCTKNIPHAILCISFKNFAFQTLIPYSLKERLDVNLKAVPFIYPTQIDLNIAYKGLRNDNFIELSSKERKTDEMLTLTITGEMQE